MFVGGVVAARVQVEKGQKEQRWVRQEKVVAMKRAIQSARQWKVG